VKFSIEMSVRGEAAEPGHIREVAQAAEDAGFALLGYTDHPAPSARWLTTGGHPTFDPFVALGFAAAVTDRIGLMTYLAVLPYRNPLLLAKSVASVDRLSGGRFTLVVGTGYLRSEFAALGGSLDDRNERFEEAIEVVRHVYADDEYRFEGQDFTAFGVVHDPKPVQLPHPPIWIGGSSRASRDRVASYGDGWAPLLTNDVFAKTVRTGVIGEIDGLERVIDELREKVRAAGRDPDAISIQLDGAGIAVDGHADAALERVSELARVGVTHLVVRPTDGPAGAVADTLSRFGADVVARAG
jgi:probable F420-dependent oxidoreductase